MQGEQALVSCGTSKGPITMRFHRDWSPLGYDRAIALYEKVRQVQSCFYSYLRASPPNSKKGSVVITHPFRDSLMTAISFVLYRIFWFNLV